MKHTAGNVRPRRATAPRVAPARKVRLNLQRRPKPEPEDDLEVEAKSSFWKWVAFVALLHLLVIGIVYFIYESAPAPKPPENFISLLPPGDVVKGTAGAQAAHKLGPTTTASLTHHPSSTPPPAATAAIQPPKLVTPKPAPPKPILKPDGMPVAQNKPIPKPAPSKPPKVKVDLTLADGPTTAKPTKPKHHPKKPVEKPKDDDDDTSTPDSTGLSKEQIAEKLGDKLDDSGIKNSIKSGTSGSANSHQNEFSAYYLMIAQQINDQWQIPNVAAEMTSNPVVHIYVEKDGRVPPESVYLIKSSGNSAYDDSAISTAKSFGYLREPLPNGCPPDISINFKPER